MAKRKKRKIKKKKPGKKRPRIRRIRRIKRRRPKRRARIRIKRFRRPRKIRRVKRRVVRTSSSGGRIYYNLNPNFMFFKELKQLILTSPPASFSRMAKRISNLGKIKLALASGVFLNKDNVADLLIVGDDIDRRKFKTLLKTIEAEVGTQVIYAIMDKEEFYYRRAMFDRFVRLMLEGPHEVLIDKIGL